MPFSETRLILQTRGASQNTRREKSPDISERLFLSVFPHADKIRPEDDRDGDYCARTGLNSQNEVAKPAGGD